MREIVSLHFGQCGCQIGNAVWELFTAEHEINSNGVLRHPEKSADRTFESFFELSRKEQYVPRALFCDLEHTVIDEIRTGLYRDLYHEDQLITGKEDASNNFARGFFTVGKHMADNAADRINKIMESCDCPSAFMIYRSLSGGTGSGFTAAMFDYLVDYSKVTRIEVPIFPAPNLSTAIVEPYNAVLGEHFCMEDIDVTLMIDNEAIYGLLDIYTSREAPTYTDVNRLIAQTCSTCTAATRFTNVLFNDISVVQTNLIPYPRIHFPLINIAPVYDMNRANHESTTVSQITRMVFHKDNQMLMVDPTSSKYMSCCLMFRGDVCPQHVYSALLEIKGKYNFVDWCPTGFKVGISLQPPTYIPGSQLEAPARSVTMLTNTAAVGQAVERINNRFGVLFSKRAYVHWYVSEGLEESELTEALYNLCSLVKDYEEVSKDTQEIIEEGRHSPNSSAKGSPQRSASQKSLSKDIQRKQSDRSHSERVNSMNSHHSQISQGSGYSQKSQLSVNSRRSQASNKSPTASQHSQRSVSSAHSQQRSLAASHNSQRSVASAHSQQRSSGAASHNSQRSVASTHSQKRSPTASQHSQRSVASAHSQQRSSVAASHNSQRSIVSAHSQQKSPTASHNSQRSEASAHSQQRSPIASHNSQRSVASAHSQQKSSVAASHNSQRSIVSAHSQQKSPTASYHSHKSVASVHSQPKSQIASQNSQRSGASKPSQQKSPVASINSNKSQASAHSQKSQVLLNSQKSDVASLNSQKSSHSASNNSQGQSQRLSGRQPSLSENSLRPDSALNRTHSSAGHKKIASMLSRHSQISKGSEKVELPMPSPPSIKITENVTRISPNSLWSYASASKLKSRDSGASRDVISQNNQHFHEPPSIVPIPYNLQQSINSGTTMGQDMATFYSQVHVESPSKISGENSQMNIITSPDLGLRSPSQKSQHTISAFSNQQDGRNLRNPSPKSPRGQRLSQFKKLSNSSTTMDMRFSSTGIQ